MTEEGAVLIEAQNDAIVEQSGIRVRHSPIVLHAVFHQNSVLDGGNGSGAAEGPFDG